MTEPPSGPPHALPGPPTGPPTGFPPGPQSGLPPALPPNLPLNLPPGLPPNLPLGLPPGVEPFPWRRLDPRMLLVHPVNELIKFLPFLVVAFVVGSSGNRDYWQFIGVGLPIALGVLRFLTTRYRITPQQIELQRGLLGKKVLTARLDRVRAVELTAKPIHRILGLAKVEIGTASGTKDDDDKFELDALPLEEARTMRAALLHRTEDASSVDGSPRLDGGPAPSDTVLLQLDPRWVRYAPLTTAGNVIAAGLLALIGQFANQAHLDVGSAERAEDLVTGVSLVMVVVLGVAGFLVLGAIFSVLGYLVSTWGFTLSRDVRGRSFHVHRGAFTTTETSIERERLRGVEIGEPLGLRLAGAGRLASIVTGLSKSERNSTQLVPPAPRAVLEGVAAAVLEDASPVRVVLQQHGPKARRRRYTRALSVAAVVPVAAVVLVLTTSCAWWWALVALLVLPLAVLVAADRYRRLGHALSGGYLVVRSGTFRGRRDVLQRSGIIGWNLQQSWFQRRAGLVTLVATTAAGQQAYAAYDLPEAQAVALADAAVPGLLTAFLA